MTNVTGVTVNILWEGGPGGETLPGAVTLNQGVGIASTVLNAVNGTSQTRSYIISSTFATDVNKINVWFQVVGTREGLVGGTTACGGIIQPNDHFVALPATGLCGVSVNLRAAAGVSTPVVTTVQDVGPWFPHASSTPANTCVGGSNPYWNTTGIPQAALNLCSSNGAGIDLADGTFSDLGLAGTTTILWRFGN